MASGDAEERADARDTGADDRHGGFEGGPDADVDETPWWAVVSECSGNDPVMERYRGQLTGKIHCLEPYDYYYPYYAH